MAIALFALHGALGLGLLWPILVEGRPGDWSDHAVHSYRFAANARLRAEVGTHLGYDPQVVAGYPHGAIDLNSPVAGLVGHVLSPALGSDRAYGLWAWLATLSVPAGLAGIAWCANGPRRGCQVLALTTVVLQLDPLLRFMFRAGTHAWLVGCVVTLTFSALFAAGLRRPRPRTQGALTLLALFYGVHVLTPPCLALVFLFLLARRCAQRKPGLGRALRFAAATAGIGALANAWWVAPLLVNLGDATLPAAVLAPRGQLGPDLLSVFAPGEGYLGSTLGLRWALLAAAGVACSRASEAPPWLRGGLLAVAAFAVVLPYLDLAPVRQLQPYRLLALATLGALTVVPGALASLWAGARRRRRPRAALLAAAPLVAMSIADGARAALVTDLRPSQQRPAGREVVRILAARPGNGRVLAQFVAGDPLPLVLARVLERPALTLFDAAQPSLASGWYEYPPVFLGLSLPLLTPAQVPERLDRYAVEWVVSASPPGHGLLAAVRSGYFAEVLEVGPYRLHRVARPTGLVLAGAGRVEARPGRLLLSGLDGPVTLRFHYAPGLTADADDVVVEAAPQPADPAGFVRVDPAGHTEVELRWRWWRR